MEALFLDRIIEARRRRISSTGRVGRDRSIRPIGEKAADAAKEVAFVLFQDFSQISHASAIEPLRIANKLLGRLEFSCLNLSLDGSDVCSSNGTRVCVEGSLNALKRADLIVLCSSDNVEHCRLPDWLSLKLRKLDRQGTILGGICTGSFLLAKLGFLDGHSCTIHWEYKRIFEESFPNVELSQRLVDVSGHRITCAGGIAALEMMSHFASSAVGMDLTRAIADMAIQHEVRDCGVEQRIAAENRLNQYPPALVRSMSLMAQSIADPLETIAIAKSVNVTPRQLQRLYQKHVGMTPRTYYHRLRLDAARDLVLGTRLSITEVGIATGFVCSSHFSTCYKLQFGVPPSKDRAGLD